MQFRKKPVVIEAVQFFADKPWPDGVLAILGPHGESAVVETLEGPMNVSDGDWIITGVKGEKYPCKPDIFALSYEPAVDAPKQSHSDHIREIAAELLTIAREVGEKHQDDPPLPSGEWVVVTDDIRAGDYMLFIRDTVRWVPAGPDYIGASFNSCICVIRRKENE